MIVCPSCQNLINEENFHREYHSEGINKTYKLYICEKCDLGFWYPLEFVEEVYTIDLLNIGHASARTDIVRDYPYPNHILGLKYLKKSKNYLSGNKLLDIGCGMGVFLREAKKIGFDVYGVDLDKRAITVAKDIFKIENVMVSSFDNFFEYAKSEGLKFDVITFFEVIEHLTDLKKFLSQVRELLKDGGIVIGSTPDRNRFLADLTRLGSSGDFPPNHFIWFSRTSLINLFKTHNFELIQIRKFKRGFRELINDANYFFRYSYNTFVSKFKKSQQEKELSKNLKRMLSIGFLFPHMIEFFISISMFFVFRKS